MPGSINIPLNEISGAEAEIDDMESPVFLYCKSGNRSFQAAAILEETGFTNIRNIGGIINYSGKIEK
ncbi:MAG: rhodanese-like domain-containing protein [Clostridiales bacterium]|nr:rhodanese-like domain-containing protein [Clostridiales bacterium]